MSARPRAEAFWRVSAQGMTRWYVALTTALLVSSCGGGGGNDGQAGPSGPSGGGNGSSAVTIVTLAASAAPATATITQLVSPAGASPVGTSVATPTSTPTGQTLIVAQDSSGLVRLAAIVQVASASTALSAETTAHALARFAIGVVDSATKASSLDGAIRATASFPSLVGAVQAAIDSSTPPLRSPGVLSALENVVASTEVRTAMGASGKSRPLAVINPTGPDALPTFLVRNSIGALYAGLTVNSASSARVELENDMAIPWSITVTTDRGATAARDILIEPGATSLISAVGSSSGFNVRAEQTPITKRRTAQLMTNSILGVVLSLADTPANCSLASASVVASAVAAEGLNLDTFGGFMGALQSSGVIAQRCGAGIVRLIGIAAAEALAALPGMLLVAWDTASMFGLLKTADLYWEHAATVGVCLEPRTGVMIDCPVSIRFSRADVIMAPRAEFAPVATLIARDGLSINPAPGALLFTSSNPAVAAVDAVSGQIRAGEINGTSHVTIAAEDPWSGARGEMQVKVTPPTVTPHETTAVLGGLSIRLTITDSDGNPILMPRGESISWELFDLDGTRLSMVGSGPIGESFYSDWIAPRTGVAGVARVSANNDTRGGSFSQARIEVVDESELVYKVISLCAVQPGTGSTIIWDTYNNPSQPILGVTTSASGPICASAHDIYHPITLCKSRGRWLPKTEIWRWIPGIATGSVIEVNRGEIVWTLTEEGRLVANFENQFRHTFRLANGVTRLMDNHDRVSVEIDLVTGVVSGSLYHFDDYTFSPLPSLWRISTETSLTLSSGAGVSSRQTISVLAPGAPRPPECGDVTYESSKGSFP